MRRNIFSPISSDRDCQRDTGSGHASVMVFPRAAIQVTGEVAEQGASAVKLTLSLGSERQHDFCQRPQVVARLRAFTIDFGLEDGRMLCMPWQLEQLATVDKPRRDARP